MVIKCSKVIENDGRHVFLHLRHYSLDCNVVDAIFAAINFVVIFAWTDCIKKCNCSGDVVVCGGAW